MEADFTQRVNSNTNGLFWLQGNADDWVVSMILKVADQWDDESITGGYKSWQELVNAGGKPTHLNMRLGWNRQEITGETGHRRSEDTTLERTQEVGKQVG